MREIKFRAWDKTEKEMHGEAWLLDGEITVRDYMTTTVKKQPTGFLHLFNAELMQYTGLKDKNGKEIYEGDILNSDSIQYQLIVSYNRKRAQFIGDYNDSFVQLTNSDGSVDAEIIGNIYENPELISIKK